MENALQHSSQPLNNHKLSKRSKKVNRDSKAIKTLGTLMGLFCVSWLPFFLMYLIVPFCSPTCKVPPLWLSVITWLGYANSFFNPCVYAFLNRDFRLAFKKILLCGGRSPYRRQRRSCCVQCCGSKSRSHQDSDDLPPVTDHLHQEATNDDLQDSALHDHDELQQDIPGQQPCMGLTEYVENGCTDRSNNSSISLKILSNYTRT